MKNNQERIAIIGLGYVGLPVAVALADKYQDVVGLDISQRRIDALRGKHDWTGEIDDERLAVSSLNVTSESADLTGCTFFIVTVPTPINDANEPDLGPVVNACQTIAPYLSAGAVVVFESTVYPGVTDDVCTMLLEKHSGLKRGRDFFLGYSPERINPGDREHRLDSITKIIAAEDETTLSRLRSVYGSIVTAGLHEAPSIKVAEAAKVIENTQRDLNIALMNELALILDRMGIRTRDVLEAAATKWNFLRFSPGLVGGHCIGVDPYYLTYASEKIGYTPEVVLAGRKINNDMGAFIANKVLSMSKDSGVASADTPPRIGVLGLTFKENVTDLRNSKVVDIVEILEESGAQVFVHDPRADPGEAHDKYGIRLSDEEVFVDLDALVFAVAHDEYDRWVEDVGVRLRPNGAIIDVRSVIDPSRLPSTLRYWSL